MYSRRTGIANENMSAQYLQAKYAAKTAARTGQRREIFAVLPEKEQETPTELLPSPMKKAQDTADLKTAFSALGSDDILIIAVLAFLLFSDAEDKDFDIILAAALLFVGFG